MTGGGEDALPPGAPRVRRPADVGQLLAAVAGLAVVVLLTVTMSDAVDALDRAVPVVVRDPLRAVLSVASVVSSLAVLAW